MGAVTIGVMSAIGVAGDVAVSAMALDLGCLTSAVLNLNLNSPPTLSPANAILPCLLMMCILFLLIASAIPCSASSADQLSRLSGMSACWMMLDRRMLPRPSATPRLPRDGDVMTLLLAT